MSGYSFGMLEQAIGACFDRLVRMKRYLVAWLRIPRGCYCYFHEDGSRCPYWDWDPIHPAQENGYCRYLGRGDWESDHFSLLWDMCKECGIKE